MKINSGMIPLFTGLIKGIIARGQKKVTKKSKSYHNEQKIANTALIEDKLMNAKFPLLRGQASKKRSRDFNSLVLKDGEEYLPLRTVVKRIGFSKKVIVDYLSTQGESIPNAYETPISIRQYMIAFSGIQAYHKTQKGLLQRDTPIDPKSTKTSKVSGYRTSKVDHLPLKVRPNLSSPSGKSKPAEQSKKDFKPIASNEQQRSWNDIENSIEAPSALLVVPSWQESSEQESFYEGSFAVFENENLLIEHPYMKDTPVSWLSIIFRNGYLTIHFKNIPIRIEDSRSKELYNSLRQFLVDRGINNPKVSKQDSKYVILGTNKFYEILEVGSIYYNALQEPDFDTLAFSKEVARLFKGRNELYEILISITKSETEKYMTVLANLHNLELNNIVTLFEKKFHSRDSDENDDCFIFTIQSGHNVYLVWESSKMKTATHIFKCDKDTLSLFLRKLQTFIMEDIKNKRSCLDHPEDFYPKELGYYKQLNHVEIKAWEKNLYKALKLRKM